jgi:hypothetical protein
MRPAITAGRTRRAPARGFVRQAGAASRPGTPAHAALEVAREGLDEPGELGRDDELRGRAGAERLEGLEVLEGHRLLVDALGGREDLLERLGEALGPEDGGLPIALGLEDLGLLGALGDVDGRLPGALGLGDDGAPRPLGGELPVHRVLDVAGRHDLADLDRRDLAAPALGDLVELDPEELVDLVALGEDLVEADVADDRPEGRRRDTQEHARELLGVEDALERVDDPPVDEEVDVDRGVVLGDRPLAGDLDEGLAEVDLERPVDDRDEEAQARPADEPLVRPAQPEDDHLLVLVHDPNGEVDQHERHDHEERGDGDYDRGFHVTSTSWRRRSGRPAGSRRFR